MVVARFPACFFFMLVRAVFSKGFSWMLFFPFAGFTFWLLSCSFLMLVPLLLLLLSAPSSSRRGGGAAAARLQSTVRARCLDALAVPLVVVLVLLGASSPSAPSMFAAILALLLRLPCLPCSLCSCVACSAPRSLVSRASRSTIGSFFEAVPPLSLTLRTANKRFQSRKKAVRKRTSPEEAPGGVF